MTQIATATARYRHAGLARMVFWGLLGLLVSPLLFADSSVTIDTMKAASSDGSMQALGKLFGSANGLLGGSGADWLNGSLARYNLGILAIASAWFSWNIASGITQGSFDGEFLGKRYHTLWMPIRNVTGVALMIPAWNGWNLAQLSMALAASLGMGLASGVAIHIPAASFPVSSPTIQIPSPNALIGQMQSGMTCVMDKKLDIKRLIKANTDPSEPSLALNWSYQTFDQFNNTTKAEEIGVNYGVFPDSDGFTSTSCGHFAFTLSQPVDSDSAAVKEAITMGNNAFKAIISDMSLDLQAVYDDAYNSIADPDDTTQVGLAKVSITTGSLAVLEKWTDFYKGYNSAQGSSSVTATRAQEAVTTAINNNGWIGAGTAGATQVWDSVAAAIKSPKTADDQNKTDSGCGWWDWVKNTSECVSNKTKAIFMAGAIQDAVGTVAGSPFIFAPMLGLRILHGVDIVTGMFLFTAIVMAGMAIFIPNGAAQAVLTVWLKFLDIFLLIATPLVIFSLQAIVMIPATIVVAWVFAVAAYYVIYMEAILASPLWGLAHMDTDGEGMGQRTSHGYLFLLNLIFRPTILVITVGFAYAFAEVVGTMMNGALGTFAASMTQVSRDNWFIGLILTGGCVWLIISANLRVAGVAASLLTIIPNQVFSWLGGQFGSNVGDGIGTQVAGDFHGGLSTGGSAGSTSGRELSGLISGKARESAQKHQQNAAAERAVTPGTKEYEMNQKRANVNADQAAQAHERTAAAQANRLGNGSIGRGTGEGRAGGGDAPSGGNRSSGLESGPAKGEKAYSAGKAMGSAMRNAATQAGALGKGVVDGLSRGRASAESAGDNPGSEEGSPKTGQGSASGGNSESASTPGGNEATGGARGSGAVAGGGETANSTASSGQAQGETGGSASSGDTGNTAPRGSAPTPPPGGEGGGNSGSQSSENSGKGAIPGEDES